MNTVLMVLVAFVFCGVVWPQIVRSRTYFLMGFAAVLAAMLLEALGGWLRLFGLPLYVARLLEAGAFFVLVCSADGAVARDLLRDIRRSFARR